MKPCIIPSSRVEIDAPNIDRTVRYPKSILEFPVVKNDDPSRIHPKQKPVELLQFILTNGGRFLIIAQVADLQSRGMHQNEPKLYLL